MDPLDDGRYFAGLHFPELRQSFQVRFYQLHGAVQHLLIEINQGRFHPILGEDLGDGMTHNAGAYHCCLIDIFSCH
jgi:hypothetical protein